MKNKKASLSIILCLCMLLWILAGCGMGKSEDDIKQTDKEVGSIHVERSDWNDEVKVAVNDLLDTYGTGGETPADTPYAVFDFDNTCSIFDIEEQTVVYQLQTMAFAIEPDHMKEIMDRWCLIQDSESNGLGFATGFLKEYDGYHSHK